MSVTHNTRSYRVRRFEIDIDRLLEFFQSMDGTRLYRVDGIPADAHCIAIDDSPTRRGEQRVSIYVSSSEFDEVELGACAPLGYIVDTLLEMPIPAVARG